MEQMKYYNTEMHALSGPFVKYVFIYEQIWLYYLLMK